MKVVVAGQVVLFILAKSQDFKLNRYTGLTKELCIALRMVIFHARDGCW